MVIDKETYSLDKKNFYKKTTEKTQIILCGSLRKEDLFLKTLKIKDIGNTKSWNTFTITREGVVYQHYDPKYYSSFMGNKKIDKQSITIVLENMGMLFFDYTTNSYLNWCHDKCDDELVYEKKWNGYTYWETYTKKQIDSTIELCDYLCEEYNIELNSLGFNVFYENTENFEGIVTRSNYEIGFTDLNPSFDFSYFLKKLDIDT